MFYFYQSFTQILTVLERIRWVNSQLLSYRLYHSFVFSFTIWLFIFIYFGIILNYYCLLVATLNLLRVENN